jgi:hypothetical protein
MAFSILTNFLSDDNRVFQMHISMLRAHPWESGQNLALRLRALSAGDTVRVYLITDPIRAGGRCDV